MLVACWKGTSRRRALGLLAALLTTAGGASSALAVPQGVRLSFTGPTHDSMTVAWNTQANVGSEVLYGTSAGNLTMSATGTSALGPGPLGWIHEVTLSGLDPDSLYYYQAGDSGDGYSLEYSFVTAPQPHEECGSFRFLMLGDNRPDPIFGGGENYDQILGEAESHTAQFVLVGGDLVTSGDELGEWATFLAYSQSTAAYTPLMPCIGNHDTGPGTGDGANYNKIFALPRSTGTYGSNTEDYYYFTYGNAIFVALSTEGYKTGNIPFADQAAWLDEVLTNNPKMWKVVYLHKPIYTHEDFLGTAHASNEEGQNAALVPVIDQHHVDVVVASHNHWYERYDPSACGTQGNPGSGLPCGVGGDPAYGTVYYVSGGAGAFTIPSFLCGSPANRASCSGDHHYLVFDVEDDRMTVETWGAYPQPSQIIDSMTIQKSGTVDCDNLGQGGAGGSSSSSGTGGSTSSSGAGGSSSGVGGSSSGVGGSTSSSGAGGSSSGVGNPGADGSTSDDGGCSCTVIGARDSDLRVWALAAAAVLLGVGRRRRRGREAR